MGSTSDRGRQFAKLRRRDEMGVPQLLEGETPPLGTFLVTGTAAGTYGGGGRILAQTTAVPGRLKYE